jgi:hypothetical protein
MWTTWAMYERSGSKYLVFTGYRTRARTKAEAVRKGSKHRRGAMTSFVMIQEKAAR